MDVPHIPCGISQVFMLTMPLSQTSCGIIFLYFCFTYMEHTGFMWNQPLVLLIMFRVLKNVPLKREDGVFLFCFYYRVRDTDLDALQ